MIVWKMSKLVKTFSQSRCNQGYYRNVDWGLRPLEWGECDNILETFLKNQEGPKCKADRCISSWKKRGLSEKSRKEAMRHLTKPFQRGVFDNLPLLACLLLLLLLWGVEAQPQIQRPFDQAHPAFSSLLVLLQFQPVSPLLPLLDTVHRMPQ